MRRRNAFLLVIMVALVGVCTAGQTVQTPAPAKLPTPAPAPPREPGAIVATVKPSIPPSTQPVWVKSVAFATPQLGWLLLGDGSALTTGDGGETWRPASLPHPFEEIWFFSASLGLARTKDQTYRTTDGGQSWTLVETTGWPAHTYVLPQFVDVAHGWVVGGADRNTKLWSTVDAGQTWAPVETPCAPAVFSFIRPSTGWILCTPEGGAGFSTKRLFHTEDGGQGWTLLGEALIGPLGEPWKGTEWPNGLSIGDYASSITFFNDKLGWFTGARYGDFMTTQDGGHTWQAVPIPGYRGLSAQFFTPLDGWITGYKDISQRSTVDITHDGGKTWRQSYPTVTPKETFYLDASTYIGALGAKLYRSSDSGANWAELGTVAAGEELLDLSYTSPAQAWALTAPDSSSPHRRLYRSGDGGATWSLASDAAAFDRHNTLSPIDGTSTWLWDKAASLVLVTDGGATLTSAAAPYDQYGGWGFQFTNTRSGWFSRAAKLHTTTDGGQTWQVLPMKPEQKAQGVALTPDGQVWAVIVDVSHEDAPVAMLLASRDGGRSWSRYDLAGFNPGDIRRCGLSSICVESSNGGPGIVSHDGGYAWSDRKR